jgi:hypothetical protein
MRSIKIPVMVRGKRPIVFTVVRRSNGGMVQSRQQSSDASKVCQSRFLGGDDNARGVEYREGV